MIRLKAAIIDDGAADYLFENEKSVTFDENLQIHENENFTTEHNHSSICINIIKKYTDISDVEWININVINSEYTGNVGSFVKALEYCRKNNVKLIHLSIGSRTFKDFKSIKNEIDLLLKNNTVVVASLSNKNEYTCPACLDGVIGVKCAEGLRDNEIYYLERSPEKINFLASSRHLLRRGGVLEYCGLSNSYATPSVTAAAIDILKENTELNVYEVIDKLKDRSKEFCVYSAPEIIKNGTEDMLETPVILVRLKDVSVQNKLIKDLKKLFVQDRYNAFCSDSKIEGEKLVDQLLFIEKFYKSDIIILGYTNTNLLDEFHSYDIIVSDYSRDEFDSVNNDTKFINFSDMNSITTFNNILKQFEEGKE